MSFNFSPLDFSQSINYHQHKLDGITNAVNDGAKNFNDAWSKERQYWDSLNDKQYERDWEEMLHNEQVADKTQLENEKADKESKFKSNIEAFMQSLQQQGQQGQQEQTPAQAQANIIKEEAQKEATEAALQQEKQQTGEKDWGGSSAENNAQYGDLQVAPMEAEDPKLAALTAKPETPAQQPAQVKLDYSAMLQDPMYIAALAQAKQTQDMTPVLNYMNTKMSEAKSERDYQHTIDREKKQDDFTQQQIDLQKHDNEKTKSDTAYVNSQMKKLSAYDYGMLSPAEAQKLRNWKSDRSGAAKKTLMDYTKDLHEMYQDAVEHEQWDLANKIRLQFNQYDALLNPAVVRGVAR